MSTEDVLLEHLSVQSLGFNVVPREALFIVGNVDTTVASTLHGTEQTRSGRSTLETNIKVSFERPWGILFVGDFGEGEGAIGFCDTFVFVGQSKLGEGATSAEEASGVCCLYLDDILPLTQPDTYQQPS